MERIDPYEPKRPAVAKTVGLASTVTSVPKTRLAMLSCQIKKGAYVTRMAKW